MIKFLLRKEIFGGTLFSIESGKRLYVNPAEFDIIKSSGCLPEFLVEEMKNNGDVRVVSPHFIPLNNFSFPDTLFIEVTRACNLRCIHCLNYSHAKIANEVTISEIDALVRDGAKNGLQEVRFTGGEPMITPEIFQLISAAASNGLRVSMGTNGTLIKKRAAKMLYDAGLKMSIVSIDGMQKEHDAIRGAGSFRNALEGVLNLKEQGIRVRVNIVAMRTNLMEIPSLTKYLHDNDVELFIRRYVPVGRSSKNASEFMLNHRHYNWLREELGPYLSNANGIVQGHYLKEVRAEPRIALPFVRNSCSVGQRALVVAANGEVQLCGFLSPDLVGHIANVRNNSLCEIWEKVVEQDFPCKLQTCMNSYNERNSFLQTNCHAISMNAH